MFKTFGGSVAQRDEFTQSVLALTFTQDLHFLWQRLSRGSWGPIKRFRTVRNCLLWARCPNLSPIALKTAGQRILLWGLTSKLFVVDWSSCRRECKYPLVTPQPTLTFNHLCSQVDYLSCVRNRLFYNFISSNSDLLPKISKCNCHTRNLLIYACTLIQLLTCNIFLESLNSTPSKRWASR